MPRCACAPPPRRSSTASRRATARRAAPPPTGRRCARRFSARRCRSTPRRRCARAGSRLSGYGVWRQGDLLARAVFALGGLVVGGVDPRRALHSDLRGGVRLRPRLLRLDLARAAASSPSDFRHSRLLNRLVAEARSLPVDPAALRQRGRARRRPRGGAARARPRRPQRREHPGGGGRERSESGPARRRRRGGARRAVVACGKRDGEPGISATLAPTVPAVIWPRSFSGSARRRPSPRVGLPTRGGSPP